MGLAGELTPIGEFGKYGAPFPADASMVEPRENTWQGPPVAAAGPARAADAGAKALDAAMDRYARGDGAAFDELYRCGGPRVRGFLLRLSGDPAAADDLTQETFIRVHRARGSFAAGATAVPWLLAIARNVYRDGVRRARARPVASRTNAAEQEAAAYEAPPETRGDEALAAREMLEVVRRTLAELPVLQREAFVLIRFEGMSVMEAAEVLGATEGAVKVRAFRAYEALRAALAEPEGRGERP